MVIRVKHVLATALVSLVLYLPLGYLCQLFKLFDFRLTLWGIVTFLIGSLFYSFYVTTNRNVYLLASTILFMINFSLSH